jgi:hypothetical protein
MAEEKEKKDSKKEEKHEHKWNSSGYCKICGCDREREEKGGDKDDKKEMKKEGKEHPEFSKKNIHKIVEDHEKVEEKKK